MKNLRFKSSLQVALVLAYPLVLLIIFAAFLIPFKPTYWREIIAFALLTCVCYSTVSLISVQRIKRYLLYFFIFALAILAFIKLSFYYHYDVRLSASALFVIFETNGTEAKDFLSNYIDFKVVLLGLIFLLPWFLILFNKQFKKRINKVLDGFNTKPHIIKLFPLLLIGFAIYQINLRFRSFNLLTTSTDSYSEYVKTKQLLTENLSQSTSPYLKVIKEVDSAQTHVVVIGESTSLWHMQLYGYYRSTNPKLSEIEDELIVFDSVITPNVHTILALDKILTLSNYNNPNTEKNASIVQLANASGYTTYWLSNQRPVGMHEAVSTQIGSAANYTYFLASDNTSDVIYDEVILPKLDTILNDKYTKRMVFIHLAGTHSNYNNRYPESYNFFKKKSITEKLSESKWQKRNQYDNAVRYNDAIVRSIIEKLREANTTSYMLYFSDHGDDVYDTLDFAGHSEYHSSRPMHEIPFILWQSEDFKSARNLKRFSKRRYSLESFIHSYSDLSNLSFKTFDSTKSIFNDHFKVYPRYIKDDIDYDKIKD